jgi:MFS family permease
MTDIQAGSTYRAVLAVPGAWRFCVAGAIGRMPMAMFSLGSLLLVAALTGRYGLAGAVSAAGAVSYAVCGPQIARLADRYGQRRVLRPSVVIFTVATAGFVACAELRAPAGAVLAAGALAGAAMPSLGSMVRARWSALLGSVPGLGTAYALESVVDELVYVVGPAVVTLLATEVQPAAGVVTAAVLCALGTLTLAGQVSTEPAAVPVTARPRTAARRAGRLPSPALVTLGPVMAALGAMFATIDLSTVAFAQQHGHKPLAGLILGTYALGSAVGGFWYGSRPWRAPLERRFAVTLGLTVAGVATFWVMPTLAALDAVVLFAGLTISPTLIAAFSLVERQARPGRRTEGMAWVSSAASVGMAAGSAIAGLAVDAGGARWGYGLAAVWGGLAAACCLGGQRRLRAPGSTAPAVKNTSAGGAIMTEPAADS